MKVKSRAKKFNKNISMVATRDPVKSVEDDIFSTSKNHSFSSEEEDLVPKKTHKPSQKNIFKNNPEAQTTTTLIQQRQCEVCSAYDAHSQNTQCKDYKLGSINTKKSVSGKVNQLDLISNRTCSCFTMRTRTNIMADSQFPSSYQDVENLTDQEIQRMIAMKMKILDDFNHRLEKKKNSTNYR